MQEFRNYMLLPLGEPSFRPYLLRALLDWIEEQGQTPYIYIRPDDATVVPRECVNDGGITLAVHSESVHGLEIDDQDMRFKARFGENIRDILIPLGRIAAVFPKENPDMMSYFPVTATEPRPAREEPAGADDDDYSPKFTKL